jgi:hypothetical protein
MDPNDTPDLDSLEFLRTLVWGQPLPRAFKGCDRTLLAACMEMNGGLAEVNRALADKSVNPAASDNQAIRQACGKGNVEIVKRLLKDKRVNPAARGNASIKAAVHRCLTDVADLLLKDPRVDLTAVHQPLPADESMSIPAAPSNDMLHLLSRTLPLPFPTRSCIIRWQPLIRRHRYLQLLRLETLIASKWHKEGEKRDVSEDVIAKYVLGVTMQEYRVLDAEYDEAKIWKEQGSNAAAAAAAAVCDICSKSGKMQVCGGCKQRSYCSRACQVNDWAQHKKVCKKR